MVWVPSRGLLPCPELGEQQVSAFEIHGAQRAEVAVRRDVDGSPGRALRLDGELVGGAAQQLAHLDEARGEVRRVDLERGQVAKGCKEGGGPADAAQAHALSSGGGHAHLGDAGTGGLGHSLQCGGGEDDAVVVGEAERVAPRRDVLPERFGAHGDRVDRVRLAAAAAQREREGAVEAVNGHITCSGF